MVEYIHARRRRGGGALAAIDMLFTFETTRYHGQYYMWWVWWPADRMPETEHGHVPIFTPVTFDLRECVFHHVHAWNLYPTSIDTCQCDFVNLFQGFIGTAQDRATVCVSLGEGGLNRKCLYAMIGNFTRFRGYSASADTRIHRRVTWKERKYNFKRKCTAGPLPQASKLPKDGNVDTVSQNIFPCSPRVPSTTFWNI